MASRTWLAVILCLLVWVGYLKWFAPPPPSAPPPQGAASTDATQPSVAAGTAPSAAAGTGLFDALPEAKENLVARTNLSEVGFSTLGGKITRVTLLQYHQTVDPSSPPVAPISPEKTPFALATYFTDPDLAALATAPYRSEELPGGFRFEASTKAGARLVKEYRLAQDGTYYLETKFRLELPPGGKTDWGMLVLPLGGTGLTYDLNQPLSAWEQVAYQSDSVTRHTFDKLGEPEVMQGQTGWIAMGNRYFAASVIPGEGALNPDVVFLGTKLFQGGYLRYPLRAKADSRAIEIPLRLYVGPKELRQLEQVEGMKQLVDYGMFSFLAYPMLQVLNFFYKYFHNYGIAIILLTILVRVLFYPLTLKSMRSMKAMQKLQPQLNALKEKYKDDRDRMNREQMALFKAHNVNPAAGCLPMLVQLPVFIALYQLLQSSMELFHAPFFGWIRDLSEKDPYYIYPVLMGVAMLLQQRMTPTPGMDPMQQKMMYILPVVFTFLMIGLPAGLTLYIFVSTLLGILQQVLMSRENRQSAAAVVPAGAPEKR